MSNELIKQETLTLVDSSVFTEEQQARVQEIIESIDIDEGQELIQFGVSVQKEISQFSDTILSDIRANESGAVGDSLTELVMKVKEVGAGNLDGSKTGLAKIPILGALLDKSKKFVVRYEKLSTQIDTIVNALDVQRTSLLKDITRLDSLFDKNETYVTELSLLIAAGQLKLGELVSTKYEELKNAVEDGSDPMAAQKLNDFTQNMTRFEKKLHDLLLSRTVAIQTAPQIRLIQGNNQTLVEKIQSSVLTTIPLWRSQVVIAISLFNQKKGMQLQREVTQTTNDLLTQNSELLKQGSIEIAKESERGIVEIETLKTVNDNLIATIEETLQIQEEGRLKRRSVEQELREMEKDIQLKLTAK